MADKEFEDFYRRHHKLGGFRKKRSKGVNKRCRKGRKWKKRGKKLDGVNVASKNGCYEQQGIGYDEWKIGKSRSFVDYEAGLVQYYDWKSARYEESAVNEEEDRPSKKLAVTTSIVSHVRRSKSAENKALANNGRVASLRALALAELVKNHDSLRLGHVSSIPNWQGVWKAFWSELLRRGVDSFEQFDVFCNFFGKNVDFPCHLGPTGSAGGPVKGSVRARVVEEQVIAKIKHRMETIAANANVQDFLDNVLVSKTSCNELYFINSRQQKEFVETPTKYVMLDWHGIDSAQALQLSNVRNLLALRSQLSSNMMANLCLSLKNGKLQNLLLLVLTGPAEPHCLLQLLEALHILYVETDVDLSRLKTSLKFIRVSSRFAHQTLQEKLNCVLRKLHRFDQRLSRVYHDLYVAKNSILMDYHVSPCCFESLDKLWSTRRVAKTPYTGYMVKRPVKMEPPKRQKLVNVNNTVKVDMKTFF